MLFSKLILLILTGTESQPEWYIGLDERGCSYVFMLWPQSFKFVVSEFLQFLYSIHTQTHAPGKSQKKSPAKALSSDFYLKRIRVGKK